jgi:hypothetical protein
MGRPAPLWDELRHQRHSRRHFSTESEAVIFFFGWDENLARQLAQWSAESSVDYVASS